ncbi:MAG: alpha/beta fold hydrolase [Microthrixaceae bacterium]
MTTTRPTDTQADPSDDLSRIRYAPVGDIELAYETFGDPTDPAILLVMGLGTQMIAWPDEMCELLADAGHHVIRFDNRDVGLSTHLDLPAPSLPDMLLRRDPAYTVGDMASDALGLLDHLEADRAHVVGASMGGFISQTLALAAPDRVLSLALLMTSTGSRRVGQASPKILQHMARRVPAQTRDAAAEESVRNYRLIGSPSHLDEELVRELAGRAYDRSYDPAGVQRQLAAILAQPNRTRDLRRIAAPTLVVHGLDDPLVAASGGLAIARAIPGATFIGHSGMGHDLPRTLWRTLTADILSLVDRVDADPLR